MPSEMRPESLRPRPDFAPPTDRGGGEPEKRITPDRLMDLIFRATRDASIIAKPEEKTKARDAAIDAINKLENGGYPKLANKLREFKGKGLSQDVDGAREVRHAMTVLRDSLEGPVDDLDRDEAIKTLSDLGIETSDILTVTRERRDKRIVDRQEQEKEEKEKEETALAQRASGELNAIKRREKLDPYSARKDYWIWLRRYEQASGVRPEDVAEVHKILGEVGVDKSEQTEIKIGKEADDEKADVRARIRVDMIKDLGDSLSADPEAKFRTFYQDQVRKLGGQYKTHFDLDFETELKVEYMARAELARVMNYWDSEPAMTEADLKRCPKLSRSTYAWLAKEKKVWYKKEDGVEPTEGQVKLREKMDLVSATLYGRMMRGDIDLWTTRGEDRLATYDEMAKELNVPVDAVRLTWQLAEAECWQARMRITFVSHPAGKLVLTSDFREFSSRKKDYPKVPGGARLWIEYLYRSKDVFPPEGTDIYSAEGRRLARVGFESWVIRVVDDKRPDGTFKDDRLGPYRKGVLWLFSETGGVSGTINTLLRGGLAVTDRTRKLSVVDDESKFEDGVKAIVGKVSDEDKQKKIREKLLACLGGERALVSGEYFKRLEALLAQPGLIDVDLPQTITMTDLLKAAKVHEAIEGFGKIDATSATTSELTSLREALTGQYFRFMSNDLDARGDLTNIERTIVLNEGVPGKQVVKTWKIGDPTTERMAKARVRVGELMNQWSRTFVWLMSWDNPGHESEKKVVGMRDWILLARDVVREYDERRQWGEFVGYGAGNFDKNENAVEEDGVMPRVGATSESKKVAEEYVAWFNKMRFVVNNLVSKKMVRISDKRWNDDVDQMGTYDPFRFWTKKWW